MKAILNDNNEIVAVCVGADKNVSFIETDFDFGGTTYDNLYKETVPLFYIEDTEIKKRTNAEIKIDPRYILFKEQERKAIYVNDTDGVFIKAFRELLKDNDIRSKLSSLTQQEVANAEMKVQEIKDTVK